MCPLPVLCAPKCVEVAFSEVKVAERRLYVDLGELYHHPAWSAAQHWAAFERRIGIVHAHPRLSASAPDVYLVPKPRRAFKRRTRPGRGR